MFDKLPELFSRNFAMAYFLPTLVFWVASVSIFKEFGYFANLLTIDPANEVDVFIGSTILSLVSWLSGIILLLANRDIIRTLEGYGRFNPLRVLSNVEKQRYRRLRTSILKLDQEYIAFKKEGKEFPIDRKQKRNDLMRKVVERFPDHERWLLPTSFGNIVRAFEVYPRVMYGIDSIPGWTRLLAVVPETYRSLVEDAKAHVDFWINLTFLSLTLLLQYSLIIAHASQVRILWIPTLTLVVAAIAYNRAGNSAIEWGDFVKSSFDIFLPELSEKLGFTDPLTNDEKKFLWQKFSQSVIYVLPESMPNRDKLKNEEVNRKAS